MSYGYKCYCQDCCSVQPAFQGYGVNAAGSEEFGFFCETCEAEHAVCDYCHSEPAHDIACLECYAKLIMKTEGELEDSIEWLHQHRNDVDLTGEIGDLRAVVTLIQSKYAEAA